MRAGRRGHLLALEGHAARRQMLSQNLIAHQRPNVTILPPPPASGVARDASATPPRIDDLVLDRLDGIKGDAGTDVSAVLEGAQESLWRLRPWLVLALRGHRRRRGARDARPRVRLPDVVARGAAVRERQLQSPRRRRVRGTEVRARSSACPRSARASCFRPAV
jgi:hypothetical protein